jgi:dihydroxyacetone kinase
LEVAVELKTFVKEAIVQIAEGIKEAQETKTGAYIAPLLQYSGDSNNKKLTITDNHSHNATQLITFDIAVTATEDNRKTGGATLKIIAAAVGAEMEKSQQNSTVSRIRFEIPIVWPEGKNPWGR